MRPQIRRSIKLKDLRILQSQHRPLADIPAYNRLSASQPGSLVISAPHGGLYYPSDFIEMTATRLGLMRSLEDTATATIAKGLYQTDRPVIMATLSRALIDLNRPAQALDPLLYDQAPLPMEKSDHFTAYIEAGYGVMPRLSADRKPLYDAPLPLQKAKELITQFYHPYHAKLSHMIDHAQPHALVVDIHSMPDSAHGKPLPDFVFGDNFGTTLPHEYRLLIDKFMTEAGWSFGWNHPYAGGYITRHYGHLHGPAHSLQIEINRRLYCTKTHHISPSAIAEITDILNRLCSQIEAMQRRLMAAE